MRNLTREHVLTLTREAINSGGHTMHLTGSMHDRFVVGGIAPAIRVPATSQAFHPATLAHVERQINEAIRLFPRAETVGSWEADGMIHFDLGSTHADRDTAVHVAGLRGERAIFDEHDNRVEGTRARR